jgi:hypothetical protein
MSLFINCQWYPENNAPLNERIEIIVGLLSDPAVTALLGGEWYRLGRSRRQALSKSVPPGELRQVNKWRYTRLSPGFGYYGMHLWNGVDGPGGITIALELNEPASRLDTLVLHGPETKALRAAGAQWDVVLSCGSFIAEELGGLVIVSSHELIDYAQNNAIERADLAAYGAFWGIDRSGKNPGYLSLPLGETLVPFSIVICQTWTNVEFPNLSRIEELIRLLRSER